MKTIRIPQLPWHNPSDLELHIPDSWDIEMCNMAGHKRQALDDDQIRASVANPIDVPPIRDAVRGKKEVVILFDDMTRVTRVARIVPFILEELKAGGVPDERIRFIGATGTHAPMNRADFAKKLGNNVLARYPVFNHNPYENHTYAGTTSRGTKVFVNAEVMQCDFRIAIGSVAPHGMTAFSGGGKIVLPGIASIDTIEANHRIPLSPRERTDYERNPRRLDMEEAAALVGMDFLVECIYNMRGDTVAIFSGASVAHEACVQEARTHYLTTQAEGKDIVIANTFAKSTEAATGLKTIVSVSHEGGDFLLICNAPEGQVVHYLMGPWGKTIGGRMRLRFPVPPHINHFIVYTEYPDIAGLGWFEPSDKILHLNKWDDVVDILQGSHGDHPTVAVYPNADVQYFGY
ncbi:MAG: DUF2088 domain-containing protein [Deltaproteobacteria bacterium]|nr:DUF2088 domain-containing protein [Deltaproteobacteria bacterium]